MLESKKKEMHGRQKDETSALHPQMKALPDWVCMFCLAVPRESSSKPKPDQYHSLF